MATLTVGLGFGFAGRLGFGGFQNGGSYERSTTTFTSISPDLDFPERQILTGTNFEYNDMGELSGGIVVKYTYLEKENDLIYSLEDFSVSASDLYAVAKTPASTDDFDFFRSLLSGDDTISGAAGETIDGDGAPDTLNGYEGNDTLFGNYGNDKLIGGLGDDSLSGGNNQDSLEGGDGKDVIDGGAGYDTAQYIDKKISVEVTLNTQADSSVLVGGTVEDTIRNIENLVGGSGNDRFTGDELPNQLEGSGGDDRLDGGARWDTLIGGTGNDIYYVDDVADKVIEGARGGTADWVATSISFALAAGVQVEKFSTTNAADNAAINLMGNKFGQIIGGNAGANILSGKAGNDTLAGAGGTDVFVFDTALNATTNVDKITDFNVPDDTIWLKGSIFAAIVGTGALTSGQFAANASGTAQDGSDRIVYETDTGKLFYDANGSNFGGSVHFATLAPNLALTGWDFYIV